MKILLWHVHGSWTTAFVQGPHDYLVPVLPDRGPDGLGRARTWEWPSSVLERTPDQLRGDDIDVVILQRPHEIALAEQWTGRQPGRDLPAIFLEHNAPEPHPVHSRHPLADQDRIPLVHVTPFNELFWDNGDAPTYVIEHGVLDPGDRYTGELARAAVVINEPARRGRMVGADLLPTIGMAGPLDVFGMQANALPPAPWLRTYDLPDQAAMHEELARRRLYVHPVRWTSLGLSLIEAMMLGLPIVAVAATDVGAAVPPEAGVVTADRRVLKEGMRRFLEDPESARLAGKAARRAALEKYNVSRFLKDWDFLLERC
jgi:glycosyltransferase involved in cell wall biosynthesis